MMSFEQKAIELAVKKLLNQRYFCVSDLRKIGEAMSVNVEASPKFKSLKLLHCVEYCDMDDQTKRGLMQAIVECLRPDILSPHHLLSALSVEGSNHVQIEDVYIDRLN